MKQNKKIFTTIAIVIIVVAIGLLASSMSKKKSTDTMSMPATSSSSSQADTSSAVASKTVSIANYAFAAPVIKVKVGDTVTWTNMDSVHHNIVADTASSDAPNGPLIGKGETYQFMFMKAGTYSYHCAPHPYMHGTVVVSQ